MYFFFSFLLCVTAIKILIYWVLFTVQRCLLAYFLFLWQFQHGVVNWTSVVGSFVSLLYPSVMWLCPGATQHPTEADWHCHSWLQYSHLGNPKTQPHAPHRAHIQHKRTRHHHDKGTRLVFQHVLGALGRGALKHAHCYSQSHIQWPFVHTSREKAACCKGLLWEGSLLPGNPRQMAKSLLPHCPSSISRWKK